MTAPGGPVAYLDHASSAPYRPGVAEAMAPFACTVYANASGSHRMARAARTALEEAREVVAAILGAAPEEVVFTSGGTEADNLAILGPLGAVGALGAFGDAGAPRAPRPPGAADRGPGAVLVCSAVEHPAVLEPCRAVARGGGRGGGGSATGRIELRPAPVDHSGRVDLGRLEEVLDEDVVLVSVMLANNEVGTVQPLKSVAAMVRALAPRALLHTDAVQAGPWLDVASEAAEADLISLSAHKLGGPKGSGVLVVRRGTAIEPLLYGGGQEMERRSGTHDVAGAVGLAMALQMVAACRVTEGQRVGALRDRLADALLEAVPGTVESVDRRLVLPGHCHLRFAGVEQEELLMLLDEAGVFASGGAACASGALEPSHVLLAMGVPAAEARTSVRFTLGHSTTLAEVEHAAAAVPEAVGRLRR